MLNVIYIEAMQNRIL